MCSSLVINTLQYDARYTQRQINAKDTFANAVYVCVCAATIHLTQSE